MTYHAFSKQPDAILDQPEKLRAHIQHSLQGAPNPLPQWDDGAPIGNDLSVVLFLVGMHRSEPQRSPESCVILNKRSLKVRQPGDICCPGGGIMPRLDHWISHLLKLPFSPLRQWDYFHTWQQRAPDSMPRLGLLLATALREGLEEMRLNPMGVAFQGILPPEQLVMFNRVIYPLVGWIKYQQRFFPNWEVERIVRVPIRQLLNPDNYILLRLIPRANNHGRSADMPSDFPAFRHQSDEGTEILWGATYRIAMNFLSRVFNFIPPSTYNGVTVEKRLTSAYLTGRG